MTNTFHGDERLKFDLTAHLKSCDNVTEWMSGIIPADFSNHYGIPIWLVLLVDKIYQGVPAESTNLVQVFQSVPVGLEIESVRHQLAVWRLTGNKFGMTQFNPDPSIISVADLHHDSLSRLVSIHEWIETKEAATKAAFKIPFNVYNDNWGVLYKAAYSAAHSAEQTDSSVAHSALSAAKCIVKCADSRLKMQSWNNYWMRESFQIEELLKSM
jgi:hypothetical protein